jgi:hypothetical protein
MRAGILLFPANPCVAGGFAIRGRVLPGQICWWPGGDGILPLVRYACRRGGATFGKEPFSGIHRVMQRVRSRYSSGGPSWIEHRVEFHITNEN